MESLNQRLAAVDHIAKRSSLVLCGNQYLADHFSQICERVTVIPTAVDIGRYHLRDKRCDGPVTIGWIGTSSNLPGLEAIAPAIDRLLRPIVTYGFDWFLTCLTPGVLRVTHR